MHYYAVIDTNVLVSAMLKFQSTPWKIINEALLGKLTPLLCDEMVTEYKEVLARPKFKFNQNAVDTLIEGLIDRGIYLEPRETDETIPDPKDVVFYEIVMEGRTQHDNSYLITGNIKHFPLKAFVVTPKEMLDIIENAEEIA